MDIANSFRHSLRLLAGIWARVGQNVANDRYLN